jgi:hypothetical protein
MIVIPSGKKINKIFTSNKNKPIIVIINTIIARKKIILKANSISGFFYLLHWFSGRYINIGFCQYGHDYRLLIF